LCASLYQTIGLDYLVFPQLTENYLHEIFVHIVSRYVTKRCLLWPNEQQSPRLGSPPLHDPRESQIADYPPRRPAPGVVFSKGYRGGSLGRQVQRLGSHLVRNRCQGGRATKMKWFSHTCRVVHVHASCFTTHTSCFTTLVTFSTLLCFLSIVDPFAILQY